MDTGTLAPSCRRRIVPRTAVLPGIPRRAVPYAVAKRALDILVSALALIVLFPVFLVVGLAIKLTSRGPILFRQTRVGAGGELFTCLKFRSMYIDAEAQLARLKHLNEMSGPVFKIKHDPRITPVGRFIRKFSIDELPQLFNVLEGSMSLVGPRPPLPNEVRQYSPRARGRLAVKPGLTCIWQVAGRNQVDFDQWVEMDLEYIERMSFLGDLALIARTVPAVLTGRGAS
jgi:exopolysaccharide biosynthesis polyprenyl glycosylphosphotransferase